MKLSDKVEMKRKLPKNQNKTDSEIITEIYNGQQNRIKQLEADLERRKQVAREPISVEISAEGQLCLKRKSYDKKLETSSVANKVLVQSKTLSQLSGFTAPLLEAAKAMYRANGVLHNTTLMERDSSGNYTKKPALDANGENLYQVDPLSRFKMLCYFLDHNEEAAQLVNRLEELLKSAQEETKDAVVTKENIQSDQPFKATPYQDLLRTLNREKLSAKPEKASVDRSAAD